MLNPIGSLEKKPLWVEFQEATELYYTGHFQEALDYFIEVTKGDRPFPEAEYMIGLLYLEEGELRIAESQIKKAISLSVYLEVPEDLLDYKYSLANIFLLKDDYDNYVNILKDIIGGDEINLDDIRDQKAYFDTLVNSGINRLLLLYRAKADNIINARILLGYYYNSIGEYKKAISYLLTPTIAFISEVVSDNALKDREYSFVSLELFFKEISDNKRVLEYYKDNGFFKLMYYLGESLLGIEKKAEAIEVWTLLANSGIDSMWVKKSKKQLLNPKLENWKIVY